MDPTFVTLHGGPAVPAMELVWALVAGLATAVALFYVVKWLAGRTADRNGGRPSG